MSTGQEIKTNVKDIQESPKFSFIDLIINSIIQIISLFIFGGIIYALTAAIWWFFGLIPGIISCLFFVFWLERDAIELLISNLIGIEYSKITIKNSLTKFMVAGTLLISAFHIGVIYSLLKLFSTEFPGVIFNAFVVGGFFFFIFLWNPPNSRSESIRNFSYLIKAPICLVVVWGFGFLLWILGMLTGIPNLEFWDIFLYFSLSGLFIALFPESGVLGGLKWLVAIIIAWEYANRISWLAGIILFIALFIAYAISSHYSENFPITLENWRNHVLSEVGTAEDKAT